MKAKLFAIALSLSFLSNVGIAATSPDTKTKQPSSSPTINKKINLNTATVAELTNSFKGIGEKRANNIVSYRTEHGKYTNINDLAKVKGIGQAFVNKYSTELQSIFSIE